MIDIQGIAITKRDDSAVTHNAIVVCIGRLANAQLPNARIIRFNMLCVVEGMQRGEKVDINTLRHTHVQGCSLHSEEAHVVEF